MCNAVLFHFVVLASIMVFNYSTIKKNKVILCLTQVILLSFRTEERVETSAFDGEVFVGVGKINRVYLKKL